jgi:c(7)-type cytochrome triheme protein
MSLDKGKDSPGTVTFSHEKHMAAGNKCTSCHVKVFKMKKGQTGPLTMEKMKAGEQCGACHTGKPLEGKTPFALADTANCEKCHKK